MIEVIPTSNGFLVRGSCHASVHWDANKAMVVEVLPAATLPQRIGEAVITVSQRMGQ